MLDTDVAPPAPCPSVANIAAWMRLPADALSLFQKLAAPAARLKAAVAGVYTASPIGLWLHPYGNAAACDESNRAAPGDVAVVKSAVAAGFGLAPTLVDPAALPEMMNDGWVKAAYSPTLRSVGEALNFFPGHYGPTGIPNHPGPAGSMLASGLLGAGLGWGGGALAETLLPDKWRRGRLRNTLAAVGAGLGVAPGLVWGLTNLHTGRPFNDPAALSGAAGGLPHLDDRDLEALRTPPSSPPPTPFAGDGPEVPDAPKLAAVTLGRRHRSALVAACLVDPELAALDKEAGEAMTSAFGPAPYAGPLAVDVDSLGRTLWETDAGPQTAGMAVGALAAAAQMPGGDDPGFVTPVQMGNLAARMGAGYLSGAMVGTALGLLTGMSDQAQNRLKTIGMYTGLVRALVPKLFS